VSRYCRAAAQGTGAKHRSARSAVNRTGAGCLTSGADHLSVCLVVGGLRAVLPYKVLYENGVNCEAMMLGDRGGVLVRPSTCVETAVPPSMTLHDSDEL
jgi:hypothetical protein